MESIQRCWKRIRASLIEMSVIFYRYGVTIVIPDETLAHYIHQLFSLKNLVAGGPQRVKFAKSQGFYDGAAPAYSVQAEFFQEVIFKEIS